LSFSPIEGGRSAVMESSCEAQAEGKEVTAVLMVGSLVDWAIMGILAVPFIVVIIALAFTDVRREQRADREAAKRRHPSHHGTSLPRDTPKAA
jgi:uncharacterized membrane protein